jgi:hypothetical protein
LRRRRHSENNRGRVWVLGKPGQGECSWGGFEACTAVCIIRWPYSGIFLEECDPLSAILLSFLTLLIWSRPSPEVSPSAVDLYISSVAKREPSGIPSLYCPG